MNYSNLKKIDIAVVGSGIGGSLISALNSNKNLILFEKEPNIGGCASTFQRYNTPFNSGATTFVGYEDDFLIKEFFDKINYTPNIKKSSKAITISIKDKVIDRVENFEDFLLTIEKEFPNKNNRFFWEKLIELDKKFWKIHKDIYFAKYGFKSKVESIKSFFTIINSFGLDVFRSANSFIESSLGSISSDYRSFIDAQLLITIQTTSKDASLLSMALGLSYPFHKTYYPVNGMGDLIDGVLKSVNTHKNEEILSIQRVNELYLLESNKDRYLAEKVILNSTVFDSGKLFKDISIKKYFNKFELNRQSAFVLYLKLDSNRVFNHHYQIILDSEIKNSISDSFFVSFLKLERGYSITISTHTLIDTWDKLDKREYKDRKKELENIILSHFLKYFDLDRGLIENYFSATPKTFNKFINRKNCGGRAFMPIDILKLPSFKTPFDNLYSVGDTLFTSQGWLGVSIGVNMLNRELNE